MSSDFLSCPVCRHEKADELYGFRAHRVWRCQACEVMYNPEFPPGESITETFSREYYLEDHASAFEDQLEDYRADPSTPAFERGLDEIEKLLGGRVGILDVGCAFGTFLRLAANRGWAAKGIEISGFASEIARERGGLEVFNGELSDAPFPEASFDAITFWDVVEHVSWPFDALVSAYRLLRPGGVLLLTTDNFDCLLSDTGRFLRWVSLGRILWPLGRLYIPFNRTYFTERTMLTTLDNAGFATCSSRKMEYPLSKIKVTPAQRLVLGAFYVAGAVLRRQAQVTVVARKPA